MGNRCCLCNEGSDVFSKLNVVTRREGEPGVLGWITRKLLCCPACVRQWGRLFSVLGNVAVGG